MLPEAEGVAVTVTVSVAVAVTVLAAQVSALDSAAGPVPVPWLLNLLPLNQLKSLYQSTPAGSWT